MNSKSAFYFFYCVILHTKACEMTLFDVLLKEGMFLFPMLRDRAVFVRDRERVCNRILCIRNLSRIWLRFADKHFSLSL